MQNLECIHVDTCLSDYWRGHHLPHICIPVYRGMTLKAIKAELHRELWDGAIAGASYNPDDELWHKKACAAVNRIKPAKKGQRQFFTDIEESDDNDCSVYAFFVFYSEE